LWQDCGEYALCAAAARPRFVTEPDHQNTGLRVLGEGACHLQDKGPHAMRKIILAAAVATAALGLSACSNNTEAEADETVEAMNADAEANLDSAGEAIEGVATQSAEDVSAAAKEAADQAEKTTDEVGDDALSVVDQAEEAGAE